MKRASWPARRILLVALALSFCAGLLLLRPHSVPKTQPARCDADCMAARLDDQASTVRNGVLQVLTNNDLLAAHYPVPPHMSFALPGAKNYGIDPRYEVFNPAGGHVDPPTLPFLVTNGNRVEGQGSDAPDMLLIVPDVDEAVCRAVAARNGGGIELVMALDLAPYPETGSKPPALDKPQNCVEYGGRYYFYSMLLPE